MSSCGTVLIVDNDEYALIELERELEGAGFNTTTTWDLSEALQLASATEYDHVLVGECFSGGTAEPLLRCERSGGRVPRRVILSARNIVLAPHLSAAAPITVCKHRVDDVLRVLSAESGRPLARAA
jgi:ActR/RegA family two-component response regulator